jgi:hypothetical protein
MNIDLPSSCFVSHAYRDASRCKPLKRILRERGIKHYMFPPISVRPDEMVSYKLIEKILDHEGLIYLEGGYSDESFWVAFERDFALRAGKPVFGFNPKTYEFHLHDQLPLTLPVFISHSPYDREQVEGIVHFMREERFFDATSFGILPSSRNAPKDKQIRSSIIEKINRGGYLVACLSKDTSESSFVQEEIKLAWKFGQFHSPEQDNPNFGRVLFAILDNTPLPGWVNEIIQANRQTVVKPVQLFGDKQLSTINRIDDLIVRLYWLIYRNTQQSSLA